MKLVDIGANLANKQFKDDLPEILHKAFDAKISHIYTTTTDEETLLRNLDICNQWGSISTTWGLHPHNASKLAYFKQKTEHLLDNKHIKAIGEFGLDYFRMISSKDEQITAMHYFLEKAKYCKLPLFMHERDAHFDFCSIYDEHDLDNNGVVHCFTGNKDQAKKYLDMGLFLGITGWVSDKKRNTDLIDALQYIPNDKILIETDSPYLKPRNSKQRNHRNEPSNLIYVLKSLAELKHITFEELANIVYNNTINFFGSENDK